MDYIFICYAVFTVLFGLAIGSFLNVVILRTPSGESIVFGRSHCMSCGAEIKARDLVPVVSYLFLRGRCRNCGAKISPRYAVIEALNAVLWLAVLFKYGPCQGAVLGMAFVSGLIIIAFTDIDTKIIPNGFIIYLALIGIASFFLDARLSVPDRLLGAAAAGVPLLVLALVTRGGMGGGDVKFAAAAGLMLGWKLALLSLFLAFIFGAVFGVVLMLAAKKSGKAKMPFAPFIAAGILISMFFGNGMITLYMTLFHLA